MTWMGPGQYSVMQCTAGEASMRGKRYLLCYLPYKYSINRLFEVSRWTRILSFPFPFFSHTFNWHEWKCISMQVDLLQWLLLCIYVHIVGMHLTLHINVQHNTCQPTICSLTPINVHICTCDEHSMFWHTFICSKAHFNACYNIHSLSCF